MLIAEMVPNSDAASPATTMVASRLSIFAISVGKACSVSIFGYSTAAHMPTSAAQMPNGISSIAVQKLDVCALRASSTVLIACRTYCVEQTAPMPAMNHAKICDQPTLATANIGGGRCRCSSENPPT